MEFTVAGNHEYEATDSINSVQSSLYSVLETLLTRRKNDMEDIKTNIHFNRVINLLTVTVHKKLIMNES